MPPNCKGRERMKREGHEDVPPLPLGAVRGLRCFRCFETVDELLKCGACRRSGYCSKDCQKLDWTAVHKGQCKVLQQVNEKDLAEYKSQRTWDEYRLSQLQRVRTLRDTTSVPDVVFIVQAQPHCSKCYRTSNQITNRGEALKACSRCKLAFHCSSCPDKHPESACALYREHSDLEQFRIELFEDTDRASVIECTQNPRTTYKSLKSATGWYDYYINISDKQYAKDSIAPDFSKLTQSAANECMDRREFEERRRKFLLLGTETMTMPLTIITALEALGSSTSSTIDIHLLGATSREFLSLTIFEELLHLLPTLKHLAITAVGPSSMLFSNSGNYSSAQELPCCPDCQRKSRKRTIASFRGLYHDFVKCASHRKPTLIVAFNSGFADGDDALSDWADTIKLISTSNVPALFTTYNEREAQHEFTRLKSQGTGFVVEPTQNPWRSLVKMPELLDDEYGFWCQNDYYYVVKGDGE